MKEISDKVLFALGVKYSPKFKYFTTEDGDIFCDHGGWNLSKRKPVYDPHRLYNIIWIWGKKILWHRVILMNYVDPIPGKPHCNHINWNKLDNRVCNLERISIRWNVVHSFKMWLNKPHRRFSEEECINIRNLYKWWMRVCDLCRKFNISKVCMINLLKWISYSDVPL